MRLKSYIILLCTLLQMPMLQAANMTSLEETTIKDPKVIIDLQLSALDRLVDSAELTVQKLKQLRIEIAEYKIKQERYLEDTNNHQALYGMIKLAHSLLNQIKDDQLQDAFDKEFLDELQKMSQLYTKISPPKIP